MKRHAYVLHAVTVLVCVGAAYAGEPPAANSDCVPKLGEFPPGVTGVYHVGELVFVDHVNRVGAMRFVGNTTADRYNAPSHEFVLLPYGTLRYHGAPADLRDIPIGTLLHGYFVLPPGEKSATQESEEKSTTKKKNPKAKKLTPDEKRAQRYFNPYTHALSLEDDFSFYERRGKAWKIEAVDRDAGKLKVTATGPDAGDGLKKSQSFNFDASTRVWRDRQIGTLADLAAGQVVQMNFTWDPDWQNGQLHVADVWVDEKSRAAAIETQRQIHIRHQRYRWLAGWIDHVEQQGNGKGIVTVTLFGGMDPSLYEQAKAGGNVTLAVADPLLRTWRQDMDAKGGPVLSCKVNSNPPTGSSGLTFRVQIRELLEGYRPGRFVRFRPSSFPTARLPPEERIMNFEDR